MRDEDRTFHMDDAVLALPAGYLDKSVNVLEWQVENGERVVLVVQRERLPEGRSFDEYVETETKDYAKRFTAFRRETADEPHFDGDAEVKHQAFRWKKDEDVLYNRQAFVRVGSLALVMTATAKAAYRAEVDEVVRRSLDGLKLREE